MDKDLLVPKTQDDKVFKTVEYNCDVSRMHPTNFIVLALIWLVVCLVSDSITNSIVILVITLINLSIISKRIHYKAMIIFVLTLLPLLVTMFISSYIFAGTGPHTSFTSNISSYSLRIEIAAELSVRLFCLALISFMFMYHMPKEQLLTYLMQRKILSVRIGYAVLATFNACSYLQTEFTRIQIAYRMRYQKRLLSLAIIFPLLVASARYAHQLSISLYSRGLNSSKTYVTVIPKYSYVDVILLAVNIVLACFIYMHPL